MKIKIISNISIGILLSCTTFFVSFAQAEDYVTKSQINVANSVAGLNANKQATADVNNTSVSSDTLQLK